MRLIRVGTLLPLVLPVLWSAPLPAHAAKPRPTSEADLLGNIGKTKPTTAAPGDATGGPPAPQPAQPSPAASPPPSASTAATAAPAARIEPSSDPRALAVMAVATQDRVKAVPRRSLLKSKRLELAGFGGVSLNDAFYTHTTAGGAAVYYPHDAFGVGVGVDYFYLHARRSVNDDVRISRVAVPALFDLPTLFAHVDLYWTPLYGKVSVFDSAIVQFDLYATAGAGVATSFGSHSPMAVNLGIGQHYALTHSLALRFEVRDYLFIDTQEANGQARSALQSYVLFYAGVSFFIPPTFENTFQ